VPGLPITVLGGIAFGPVWGTVYVWIAATIGAGLAFLVARHAARGTVERWVRSMGQVMFGQDDQPTRFVGTVIDISEQKRTQLALKTAGERLAAALEAGAIGTYFWDMRAGTVAHDAGVKAIFGLAPGHLQAVVSRLGGRVRGGERFEHGDVADGVLDGRAVAFRRIVPRHYPAFLAHAVWYHDGARFPALQGVWADEAGRFPWDRWFRRELRDAQPVLFEPEPA